MERIRVNKYISIDTASTIYVVIEQPGDCTRYNHLIYVDRETVSCIGFKHDWRATLKNELTFNKQYLMQDRLNLIGIDPYRAVKIVSEKFQEHDIDWKQNIFTTASAIRCMQEVIRNHEESE